MPVTSVTSDLNKLELVAIGDYPVPVERLWAAWSNPRQLERFWGPPSWPATFTRHELRPGGRCEYAMTGPNGESSKGYWTVDEVEPGRRFVVRDGFADESGKSNDALPSCRMEVRFEPTKTGSRFVATTVYGSMEAMQTVLSMGMIEGLTTAMSQLDAVLADLRDYSKSLPTALELVDDTHARVVRDVRGTLQDVWRAHHEPALMKRWLLGPDGWTMPVCEVATKPGDTYRYEWADTQGANRFGFTGTLTASEAPRRAVTTERMLGTDGPEAVNELVLSPLPGGRTRIALTIAYPSREVRDMVLGTGMVDGMEASYARLETVLA